jgi:hypothetical protein
MLLEKTEENWIIAWSFCVASSKLRISEVDISDIKEK